MTVDSLRTAPSLPADRPRVGWDGAVGPLLAGLGASRAARFALLAALMLASGVLRTRQLDFHYWVDEGISVGISSHHLGQLPALLRQDGSPPLYYLLLHVWMQLWGRGEAATHTLSLIFALAAIPVAYWGAASLFDRRTGACCAVLAAGLPFLTSYAQETRMYSLVLLLSIVVALSFVQAFVCRRRGFVAVFVASLTAALYTHDWALFLALACLVGFLTCVWLTPGDRHGLWRDGALALVSIVLLYLPWLPTLLYQAQHTGAPWARSPDLWSLSQGLYFLVGGRGAAVALLLAAGCGVLALRRSAAAAAGAVARERRREVMAAISLGILGVGSLLVAWLYAKHTPAWSPRYLAIIAGPLMLLVGLGLVRAGRLGAVALVLVCCFWLTDPRVGSADAKSNVASAASAVRPQLGAGALVLSTQPEQVPTLAYYLPRVRRFGTPLGPVADPRVMDWRNALARFRRAPEPAVLAALIRSLRPGERVALVVPIRSSSTPLWAKLIHRSSLTWTRYLRHDPQLKLLKVVSPDARTAGLAVRISLFGTTDPPGTRGGASPGGAASVSSCSCR